MKKLNTIEQQQVRKNVSKLHFTIQEAIDKACKESNYEITYVEINYALTDILRSNLGYELKSIWEEL